MKSIAQQWEDFSKRVLPQGASEVQVREMKKAFYAGAYSFLENASAGFSPEADATEEDIAGIDKLHAELEAFLMPQGKVSS